MQKSTLSNKPNPARLARHLHSILITLAVAASSLPAAAHEFWMTATPFSPAVGGTSLMELHVGQNLDGELIGFSSEFTAALKRYTINGTEDLRQSILTKQVIAGVNIGFKTPGTHVVTMDSIANFVTLSGDKFHAYLHDEGLDFIIDKRVNDGTAATPSRERYHRNVKSILRVGDKSDATFGVRTGQRLEIVPLENLLDKPKGSTLNFKLYFDQKPLAGALIKAWHQHDNQIMIIKARSTDEGDVALTLPYAGPWMLSVVHMIPVTDSPDVDWDSYWGNLTFEMSARTK